MELIAILKQLRDAGALDGALKGVGLETREGGLTKLILGAGIFAAGALLGAGAGLALAPMTGEQMRDRAKGRVDDLREKVVRAKEQAEEGARNVAGSAKNIRKQDTHGV